MNNNGLVAVAARPHRAAARPGAQVIGVDEASESDQSGSEHSAAAAERHLGGLVQMESYQFDRE